VIKNYQRKFNSVYGVILLLACLLDQHFRFVIQLHLMPLWYWQRRVGRDEVRRKIKQLAIRQNPQNLFLFSTNNLECVCSILTGIRESLKKQRHFDSEYFKQFSYHDFNFKQVLTINSLKVIDQPHIERAPFFKVRSMQSRTNSIFNYSLVQEDKGSLPQAK